MDLFADPDYVLDELEQRGPDVLVRDPRPGDPIVLYGDRRTVLAYDRDAGRVTASDAAGFPVSRHRSVIWWDGDAWRTPE